MRSFVGLNIFGSAPDAGILFGLFLAAGIYKLTLLKTLRRLAFVPFVAAAVWLLSLYAFQIAKPAAGFPTIQEISLDEDTEAKLDEQTKEMLRESMRVSGTFSSVLRFAAACAIWSIFGILSTLCLIAGLRFVFELPISKIDFWWSGGLGLLAGLFFCLFYSLLSPAAEQIVLFGELRENTFGLISWRETMLAYASAFGLVAASVGHWLGRTAG
jgi:hypothetical protein